MPPRKLSETREQDLPEANKELTEKLIAEVTKPIEPVKVMPDMVWVKVRNVKQPGEIIGPFFYEDLAFGIPRTSFTFFHDKDHTDPIPRKVMDAVNECKTPIYKNVQTDVGTKSHQCGFEYLYQCIEVRH